MARAGLLCVCLIYLVFSCFFGSLKLDSDEFSFVKEPYAMLGGDYTVGYLREGQVRNAANCILKSYFFFWNYRPLMAPVIKEEHKQLFRKEESKFGYRDVPQNKPSERTASYYQEKLIVPEPDRFYRPAGKPLLNAILSIPSLALVQLATLKGEKLLYYQFHCNYHPIFLVVRLTSILCGLASIILVYRICRRSFDEERAVLAGAVVALFPISIMYFPNIHHDAVLVPFAILTGYFFAKREYVRAGLSFGLALAAKNAAIFLLLPIALSLTSDFRKWLKEPSDSVLKEDVLKKLKGIFVFAISGLMVLIPFANPISYAQEMLTPFINRPIDPRGMGEVERVVFKGGEEESSDDSNDNCYVAGTGISQRRPEIAYFRRIVPFRSTIFLVILGIPLIFEKVKRPLSEYSLYFLLTMFPYAFIFGSGLGYRHLVFIPFMALLCGDVLSKRHLKTVLTIFLLVDILFCVDPISVGRSRVLSNQDTLFRSLFRSH